MIIEQVAVAVVIVVAVDVVVTVVVAAAAIVILFFELVTVRVLNSKEVCMNVSILGWGFTKLLMQIRKIFRNFGP